MTGIIALDIDGTLTSETHRVDPKVVETLVALNQEGWKFIFITGRPFQWGFESLQSLPFPYALAVQNGAVLLEMPSKKVLGRCYLNSEVLPPMEAISREQQTDFVIYSGYENDDWCFYRPACLPPLILHYVLTRTNALQEKWKAVDSYAKLPISQFSSLKFFVEEAQALSISQQIEKELNLHAPPNRDPFNPQFYVVQVTHQEATKGDALKQFMHFSKASGPIIAGGDDWNDLSMLKKADVKIAMANAPSELLKMADVIAPPADQLGIIQGLRDAVQLVKGG